MIKDYNAYSYGAAHAFKKSVQMKNKQKMRWLKNVYMRLDDIMMKHTENIGVKMLWGMRHCTWKKNS